MNASGSKKFVPPEGGALLTRGVVWVITADKLYRPGKDDASATGTAGPHQATKEEVEQAAKHGRVFRMLDDDGIVYFHGRILTTEEHGTGSELDFVPLDEFGRPDSGAVEIQYMQISGRWETL